MFPPFQTKLLSTAFEQLRPLAMEMSELRFSCGILESSHEQELKGSEDFNGNDIGLALL